MARLTTGQSSTKGTEEWWSCRQICRKIHRYKEKVRLRKKADEEGQKFYGEKRWRIRWFVHQVLCMSMSMSMSIETHQSYAMYYDLEKCMVVYKH